MDTASAIPVSEPSPIASTPEQWRQSGESFEYRGHRIFYRDQGSGDALLLLHGFPTSSWDWQRLWPLLVPHYRLIAPDYLGFGFSAKPPTHDYTIADQAASVEALLAHLKVTRIRILAHDYGDTVAQELLARLLARQSTGERASGPDIAAVCFLNGGLFPEAHRPRLIQRLLLTRLGPLISRRFTAAKFAKSFPPLFGPDTKPSPQELAEFWCILASGEGQRVLHKLIRYIPERVAFRSRWVGALQNAGIPLRLIAGAADPVSGLSLIRRYREVVAQPDLVVLDRIGHYPQVEAPEAVARECLAFFRAG